MRVIIVGCGRVGALVANRLSQEGHDVVIIDKDPMAFERLGKAFRGQKIEGVGFDKDVLKQAIIEKADAFASITSGDNTNIVCAVIAKDIFRVPIVVARIFDPLRAEIYRRLGVPTVSAVAWASNQIRDLICHRDISSRVSLGNGEVEILEIGASSRLAGKKVADLSILGEIQVVAITRLGKAFIPTMATTFNENDNIEIAVLNSAMPKLEKMLSLR
jgi:trk system potassium uptake protein TrkA